MIKYSDLSVIKRNVATYRLYFFKHGQFFKLLTSCLCGILFGSYDSNEQGFKGFLLSSWVSVMKDLNGQEVLFSVSERTDT